MNIFFVLSLSDICLILSGQLCTMLVQNISRFGPFSKSFIHAERAAAILNTGGPFGVGKRNLGSSTTDSTAFMNIPKPEYHHEF